MKKTYNWLIQVVDKRGKLIKPKLPYAKRAEGDTRCGFTVAEICAFVDTLPNGSTVDSYKQIRVPLACKGTGPIVERGLLNKQKDAGKITNMSQILL